MAEDGDGEDRHSDRSDGRDSTGPDEGPTDGPVHRTPRETVDELSDEDLTDLDEVEGIQIESPEAPIERGTIDRENALFVILGVVLSVVVFLEFLSVLPAG